MSDRFARLFEPVHSPVQPLHDPVFVAHGVQVLVKREDLIHPYISGNKWRKLKYNLLAAAAGGKTELLTFGGAYSNHLVAVACAGKELGFATRGMVRGDERPQNHMLDLCAQFGMQLEFVSREDYRNKAALADTYGTEASYLVPEGGTNAAAVSGCAELVGELTDPFDHVVVAVGTGGTLAGIAKGMAAVFPHTQVHGIAVLKGGHFLRDVVVELVPGLGNWILHTEFHLGGYGKVTPELLQLVTQKAALTGITFDRVYTGKVLLAARELVSSGVFASGSRVLLIHTGGVLGNGPMVV